MDQQIKPVAVSHVSQTASELPNAPVERRHAPPREPSRAAILIGFALLSLLYFAAAAYLVYRGRDVLNSDAVAYLRIAQYYAQGRFDLAVNSSWGPMLSWLVVPAAWLNLDLPLAARVVQVLSGFGFAIGVALLTRRLANGQGALLGMGAGLLLALPLIPPIITPDLTLAFFMTLYFALTIALLEKSSLCLALAAGFVGGLAFLTKHYALPFVGAHLALTAAIRLFLVRKGLLKGPALRPILVAGIAFAVVALPWVAAMSRHDGKFTLSSAGPFAADYTYVARHGIMFPNHKLQMPREGRIVASESRLEGIYPRPGRPPLLSIAGLEDKVEQLKHYGALAINSTKSMDLLAFVLCAMMVTVLHASRSTAYLMSSQGIRAIWICLSVGIYVGGYVMMNVEERLLWPLWGLLLAFTIAVFVLPSRVPWASPVRGRASRWAAWAWGFLLVLSLGFSTVDRIIKDSDFLAWSTDCRKATTELPLKGRFAVNGNWNTLVDAYALAYRTNTPFLGLIEGHSPDGIARELTPFGDTQLLVLSDPGLTDSLKLHPQFELLKTLEGKPYRYSYNLFAFHPASTASGTDQDSPG